MADSTVETIEEQNSTDSLEQKIQSQFNEEKWTRISAKDVSISRFKLLESIFDAAQKENKLDLLEKESKEHLVEYEPSVAARYFLGMSSLKQNRHEDIVFLKQLLDQFQEAAKWAVVEYLSDKMLAVNENRTILRAKALALEKLGKQKDSIPVLEKLAKLDRKNPDVSLKYADAIIEEDLEKGIQYYKLAAESFAKNLQFEKLKTVWNKLCELIPEDFAFYKKIERILNGHRQKEIIADLYTQLAMHFIKKEDNDNIIELSKKILTYNPNFTRFKNEIIKALRAKYKDHSLLEDFIKYSGLLDTRKNIINAIGNFETNIVFDKGNYVYHRSWGVGKIKEINNETMTIDFKDKPAHKMEIQMALKSLKPLKEDHFWVFKFEKPEELKKLFQNDLVGFFKMLLSSFGNQLSLNDIKAELTDFFVPLKDWSKWWNKSRAELLKNPLLSVSSQKKDIIELNENSVTKSESIIERFQLAQTFEEKLNVTLSVIKDPIEAEDALEFMVKYFKDGLKSLDIEVKIISLLTLDLIQDTLNEEEALYEAESKKTIIELLKKISALEAAGIEQHIKATELKRLYAKLIKENHPQWQTVFSEMLLHTPIKIHRILLNDLLQSKSWDDINNFFARLRKNSKEYAEVFLWTIKHILTDSWEIPDFNMKEHLMSLFRLLRNIEKIETKGTKLRNSAKDILFGNFQDSLFDTIKKVADDSVRKMSALFKDVNIFNDFEKDKIVKALMAINPSIFEEELAAEGESHGHESLLDYLEKKNKTVASVDAIERMQKELEHILNVEMPENSKEIGLAQEKGDLRENAEYKAAMEKQAQLQAHVTKLENEIKIIEKISSNRISNDQIGVGNKVKLNDEKNGFIFVYTILDQWDADIDKGIISYKSPLGRALLGKKVGDVVNFGSGADNQTYKVISIDKAINNQGRLV